MEQAKLHFGLACDKMSEDLFGEAKVEFEMARKGLVEVQNGFMSGVGDMSELPMCVDLLVSVESLLRSECFEGVNTNTERGVEGEGIGIGLIVQRMMGYVGRGREERILDFPRIQVPKTGIFQRSMTREQVMNYNEVLRWPILDLKGENVGIALSCFCWISHYIHSGEFQSCLRVLDHGIKNYDLRDELYCQVVKQLTNTPIFTLFEKGWEVMVMFLCFFPPSKQLENYLESFLCSSPYQIQNWMYAENSSTVKSVQKLIVYSVEKLSEIKNELYTNKRVPTVEELKYVLRRAFSASYFSLDIEEMMVIQGDNFPDLKIPFLIHVLIDLIRLNNGLKLVGLFRNKPGQSDISNLKIAIDNDEFEWEGNPLVPATILKTYLRESTTPVIPNDSYQNIITFDGELEMLLTYLSELPDLNRFILREILQLARDILAVPENLSTVKSIGVLLGPVLFRCPETDFKAIAEKSKLENETLEFMIEYFHELSILFQ